MKTNISILFTLFFLLVFIPNSFAQRTLDERIEIDFSFGSKLQLTNQYSGVYKDFFKSDNYFLFKTTISIALKNRWRVWGDLSYAKKDRNANNNSYFSAAAAGAAYDLDKYYIENLYDNFDTNIWGISAGFGYKFIFNKWSVEPRLGFGVHIVSTDTYGYTAKEKGSYQIYRNSLSFDDNTFYSLHLDAGTNINYYFLNNRLYIGAGIYYQQSLTRSEAELYQHQHWGEKKYSERKSQEGNLMSTIDLTGHIGVTF